MRFRALAARVEALEARAINPGAVHCRLGTTYSLHPDCLDSGGVLSEIWDSACAFAGMPSEITSYPHDVPPWGSVELAIVTLGYRLEEIDDALSDFYATH